MADRYSRGSESTHHYHQRSSIKRTTHNEYQMHPYNHNMQSSNWRLLSSQNAVPMIGTNISINPSSQQARGATGFIPASIIPGLTQNKNRFIKSQQVPSDIYIQTVYPQNQPIPISMILPVDRQIGQILKGKCLKYCEQPINIYRANDDALKQYMSTRNHRDSERLRQKIFKSPVQKTISGFLYVADLDDEHIPSMDQQKLIRLLNQKENQLITKQKLIQNMNRRITGIDSQIYEMKNHINFLDHQLLIKNKMLEERSGYHHEQSQRRNQQITKLIQKLERAQRAGSRFQTIDLIINQETRECSPAEAVVFQWIHGLSNGRALKELVHIYEKYQNNEKKYRAMQDKLQAVSTIYRSQLQTLKRDNPLILFNINEKIFEILRENTSVIHRTQSVIQVQRYIQKTIQVPIQDQRTKDLIKLLTMEMKKIYNKHPKLLDMIDSRLAEYFSQQMINQIDVDTLDRVVSIIKYVPQIVRVENVYSECRYKTQKKQFHLRILLKSLLQSIQKMREKFDFTLQLDQTVIEMIRRQIMDIVNIEDILRVFQVNKKVVQVQKVIQRIVDRIVEVPVPVHHYSTNQVPVPLRKPQVLENIVHVGLEVPKITSLKYEKLVKERDIRQIPIQVPTVINNIIQCVKQVPQIHQVVVHRDVPVHVVQLIPLPQMIKQVPIYRDIVKQVRQQIPFIKQIIREQIKQVPRFEQKLVIQKQQVFKYVEVNRPQIVRQVQIVPESHNYIETKYTPVDLIVQKAVQVQVIHERIVQVPQIVQKIVKCVQHNQVLKQITVQKPYIVRQEIIKQVPVPEHHIMDKEVQKVVEKIVQVPFYEQVVRIQKQYYPVPQPVHTRQIIHQQVQLEKPVILYQDRVIEFDKIIPHIMRQQVPIKLTVQKIIECIKQVDRVHTVRLLHQKIVEKIVEVPKVIEVQKIVEKIVIVPRIIQKIVQVPKIIQVAVENTIIQERIIQVEKIIEVPCIREVQRIVEVQVNHYIQKEVPVKVKQQIMVVDTKQCHTKQIRQVFVDRIVVQRRQVPKQLEVTKIVPLIHEVPRFIEKQIIVPVEIQIPQYIHIEKPVPVNNTIVEVMSVDRVIEKVVECRVQEVKLVEVPVIREVLKTQQVYKQIERFIPAIRDIIKQIQGPTKVVQRIKQKCIEVQVIVDKIVPVYQTIREPQFHEIIKQIAINVPELKIIRQLVPKIIEIPKIIELLIDRIIEVPYQLERLKQVIVEKERIVNSNNFQERIVQVHLETEKEVILQRLVKCTDSIHEIEQVMKVIETRHIQQNPKLITRQKIIQVPVIIEKIVEKIILMPQVVQILKYIHQVCEQSHLDGKCEVDVGRQETKYKLLSKNIQTHIQNLLRQLKSMRGHNKHQIQTLQNFLIQFKPFLTISRFHEMIRDRQVQRTVIRDQVVHISGQQTSDSLSKLTIIEHLIKQLKRIKRYNPQLQLQLPRQISQLFISQQRSLDQSLYEYRKILERMFSKDEWSQDQKRMFQKFLDERYNLASELKSSKKSNKQYNRQIRRKNQQNENLKRQRDILSDILKAIFSSFDFQSQRKLDLQNIIENLTQILRSRQRQFSLIYNQDLGSLTREHQQILLNTYERAAQENIVIPNHWDNTLKIKYHAFQTIMREFYHRLPHALSQHEQVVNFFEQSAASNISQQHHIIREQQQQILRLKSQIIKIRSREEMPNIIIHQDNQQSYNSRTEQMSRQIRRLREIQQQHRHCFENIQILQKKLSDLQQIERQYRMIQQTTHRTTHSSSSQTKNRILEQKLRETQHRNKILQSQIQQKESQIKFLRSTKTATQYQRRPLVVEQEHHRTYIQTRSQENISQVNNATYGVQYKNYTNAEDPENSSTHSIDYQASRYIPRK